MRGLDPRIHLLRKKFFKNGWIAGSSPAMTTLFYAYALPGWRFLAAPWKRLYMSPRL
jgi:hypothetical protein